MGAPVVLPLNTPLLNMGKSSSLRGVVPFWVPPFLLSMSSKKSSTDNDKPAGQPSIFIPADSPCDSPNIDTRNILPNEFIITFRKHGVSYFVCKIKITDTGFFVSG